MPGCRLAAVNPDGTLRRSRIPLLWKQRLQDARLSLTRSFLLKLSTRKKTKVPCLLDGHRSVGNICILRTVNITACR
jgi:hypothetical protein